jgi:YD repeat-containing protein
MKYIYNSLLLLFTTICFSQQILNTKETTSRTVSDPRTVILSPGFNAKGAEVSTFIAKVGISSEPPASGGTTNSTAGSSNPSGEVVGSSNFHDTKGNIDVSSGGQLQFSLPIALPPGIKSVAPQINLVYTSGSGNGIAGMGFSLNGITSINRTSKNIEKDGESKGVQLDYTDFYEFNGQRLLLKSGEYGKDGAEYVTEKFSTLKIKSVGAITGEAYSGPNGFEVTFDNGSQGWYGTSTNSRTPLEYNLVKWKDAQGNCITYNYTKNNNVSVISTISWGGNETLGKPDFNSITFNYDSNRTVKEASYVRGVRFLQDKILNNIVVNANGSLFKKYVVEYKNDTNGTFYQYVNKITEYNAQSQAANPVTFNYESSSSSGWTSKSFIDSENNKIVGDFDGDGVIDYLKYYDAQPGRWECIEYSECDGGGDPDENGNFPVVPCCIRQEYIEGFGTHIRLFKSFFNGNVGDGVTLSTVNFTRAEFNNAKVINIKDSNNQISSRQGILISKRLANKDLQLQTYSITKNLEFKLESTNTILSSQYEKMDGWVNGNCDVSLNTSFQKEHPVDLDGDGLSEIVIPIETNHVEVCFDPSLPDGDPSQQYRTSEFSYTYLILNLDKELVGANDISEVSISDGFNNVFKDSKIADFTGEGKIQILNSMYGFNFSGIYFKGTSLTSFKKNKSTQKFTSQVILDYTNKSFYYQDIVGDFNGDRKADILAPVADNSKDWRLYLSTGKGFKEDYKTGLLLYRPFEDYKYESGTAVDYYKARKQTYQAIDLDKDGKSELVHFNYFTQLHLELGYEYSRDVTETGISIYKNIGANALSDVNFSLAYNHTLSDQLVYDFSELVGDYSINQIDNNIILTGIHRATKSKGLMYSFNLYDSTKSSRINAISQGGVTTNIDYKELDHKLDQNFYTTDQDIQYPFVQLEKVSNSFIVSQLRQMDRKQDFKYRGLLAHVNGRGMIGFRKFARSNWYATGFENTKVWSGQEIDPLQNGVIIKQWSTRVDNDVFPADISVNNNQLLSFKQLEYIVDKPVATGPEAILPQSSIEKDFLKNTTTTSTITYGDYYLPTKVVTSINNGFATTTSNTTYENNASGVANNYYMGRITQKEEIVSAYGDIKKSKTKYTYQNNLPETVKTYNQDESEFILETYKNDGFGNTLEKTVTNSKDAQIQNTKIEFDTKGRFAIKSTDNLGLITQTSYNDVGQVLTQTDPLGNTITNTYDSWGKPLTVKNNLTGTTTYTYKKEGDDIVTTQYSPDGNIKETRTNKKGEQYFEKTKGFESGTYIAKQVEYDKVGRKIKESEPYFTSGTIKWNTISYDDTTYPAKVTGYSFNGKILETQIIDKTTTVKELNGYSRITKKTADALGNVVESEDKGGIIKFTFNAQGQNVTATYGQNVVTTTYDTWGRKASFKDPSNGLYKYEYDGFGKLIKETSPKGTKEYTYNAVGQLITQKELSTDDGAVNTNKTIPYSYDAKGLIKDKTGTANGKYYNSYINYDANGRITSTGEKSNDRFFFKKNITYDDKGRVTSYEKGLYSGTGLTKTTIENIYSGWDGALFQLKDKNTAKVLWELQKAKANGQVLQGKLGNVAII